MHHISPTSLSTHLPSRIAYLSSFLSLTPSDTQALLAAKPLLAPLIPPILDAVYAKLLQYDITARAFVPRNTDYAGEEGTLAKSVQELTLEHPQIAVRKDFLKNYLVRLVSTHDLTPESPFWTYLDNVAVMHTGKPGFKHREKRPELRVEYIHMGALLGFVEDRVVAEVLAMDEAVVDGVMKARMLRALNKVLWIQNDLFARHYIGEDSPGPSEAILGSGEGEGGVSAAKCPFSG